MLPGRIKNMDMDRRAAGGGAAGKPASQARAGDGQFYGLHA